jgi:hypothetical protein
MIERGIYEHYSRTRTASKRKGVGVRGFPLIPASKTAISARSLVCGRGLNDAWYKTYLTKPNRRCPFYRKWDGMLSRCYSGKYLKLNPTYEGCFVATDWLLFSNFREWMCDQDWEGKELDKDLLYPGNKEYSPDKCLFVSKRINVLISDKSRNRDLPQGISMSRGKYMASCRAYGKSVNLGRFDDLQDAIDRYAEYKSDYIRYLSRFENDQVKKALINYADNLKEIMNG